MSKISGFTEWLPEQKIVELQWMDEIFAAPLKATDFVPL